MTVHACTIIARNYLAAARVLATSFSARHPDGQFTTLVIDDVFSVVDDEAEPFRVLRLDEIGIDRPEMLRMAAIYSIMELSTAVKPWLLKTLLDEGAPAVLYLDPDIEVFADLEGITSLACEHGIVLTPHVTRPLPRDGRSKSETEVLESGIYNLGFVAVSAGALDFLEFWQERLARDCVSDPKNMHFVDQRWVDFVPGIYDAHIMRGPGSNVAYWNLDHREVSRTPAGYLVNDEPLLFFHFSGYDPRQPYLLSKHQGSNPRILFSERPVLKELCDAYGSKLFASGYADGATVEYGYARLPNGAMFDNVMRRLYRESLLVAEQAGDQIPPNPFDRATSELFIDWLNQASPRTGFGDFTRYLAALYESRPDLKVVFPDPAGADKAHFVGWIRHEVGNGHIDDHLAVLDPGTSSNKRVDDESDRARSLVPGIRVAGYLKAETGVGEHARLAVKAAQRAGISTSTFLDATSVSRQLHPFVGSARDDLNVNLVCVNADEVPNFVRRVGPEFFSGRYTIGLWAWELEEFPTRFSPAFDFVDEIWANSEFTRAAIAAISPKPVFAFPLPIAEPTASIGISRRELGIPEGFCFLFCFDLMSVAARKNPLGLIEAFSTAFQPGEGPTLVIKAVNGERKVPDLERLKMVSAARPDIVVIDQYFDSEKNTALMATCDCYVSLHRSEGFGLTLAEAMALGKPVIATAYSGNLDFMTESTSYLVPFTSGEVPAGCEPYPKGARWAEPDLDAAAQFMRAVYEHPEEASARGARDREHVLTQHGLDQRATFIAQRFAVAQEAIESDRGELGVVVLDVETTPELIGLARQGRSVDGPSRYPRVARFLRRSLRRLLRHHDAYQQEMNLKLAMGVEHIARLLGELRSADAQQVARRNIENHLAVLKEGLIEQGQRLRTQDTKLMTLAQAVADDDDRERTDAFVDFERTVDELHSLPFMSDPDALVTTDAEGRLAIGYTARGEGADGRLGFEDLFRGSEDFIRGRQRRYLDLLVGKGPVIEVGSGRGEFLDLLAEAGIEAIGVDHDPSMVKRARSKGHEVVEADAIPFLLEQSASSCGAIFGAQVIEHLGADELSELLQAARRALRHGGLLVLETVNPYSLRAFRAFWTDLSHRSPIYPEVLVTCCREAGFDEAIVLFPNGSGDLAKDRWDQGEYAVIARIGSA